MEMHFSLKFHKGECELDLFNKYLFFFRYLSPDPPPRQRLLVNQDGRRMNVNEPK